MHSSENSLCSTAHRHSGGEPAPYHDTGQESSLPSLPTLDYRRKDCRHFHLPWCRWQPAWLIAMKIGSGKPVVGATLVVARSRRQPVFIPLCGLRNAMVILRSAATKNLQSLPRRADRGRQNGIVAMIQPRLPVIPLKIACVPPPTVIPAESLPRTPIRGRNPVSRPCQHSTIDGKIVVIFIFHGAGGNRHGSLL